MIDKPRIGPSTTLRTALSERSESNGRSRTIGILSLGCPRNLTDSESILGKLNLKGYTITENIDKADVAIVNTCAFIEDAKRESIDAVLDLINLKRKGSIKKIIVYGCLTQRYKDKLRRELPQVDAFVGTVSLNHNINTFSITPKHYAYLKICEGCINNCSYCIIPKIKPKFNSLDLNSIVKRVEILDKSKISELNIIGQDITGWGLDLYGTMKLPKLLNKIIKVIKNIGWIRLLYLYPSRITDELLGLIKDEPKICKYIDLPIQHINARILRLMHRLTKKQALLRLIDKIRQKLPAAALRTSLIVGFPSEGDREFKELLEFIKNIKFERLGVFVYSREEDTLAYNFKKQIPHKIKIERFNAIMSQQQAISEEINKRFLGKVMTVLIDEKENGVYPALSTTPRNYDVRKGGVYLGRSQYDAPEVDGLVFVHSKNELNLGDFVKVKITDTLEYDLVGETLE